MVASFRKQVLDYIVPVAVKLKEGQRKRLGLDSLMYYDDKYNFSTGNAVPKGTPEYIVDCGKKMYSELSPDTEEFFNFMTENNLLDLLSKKAKQAVVTAHSYMPIKPHSYLQTLTALPEM